MARLHHGSAMTPGRGGAYHPDAMMDLSRLLSRMQQSLLYADAARERRLRTSEYERHKANINLDYARSLLTKLEQEALGVKVLTRRQDLQIDLNRKRELFDQLKERLRELEDLSIDSDDDDEGDYSDEEGGDEDLLAGVTNVVVTPSESADSSQAAETRRENTENRRDSLGGWGVDEDEDENYGAAASATPQATASRPQDSAIPSTAKETTIPGATATSQTLRPRNTAAAATSAENNTAQTTGRQQTALSTTTRRAPSPAQTTAAQTTESILDHHRAEQDKLTASLVHMASALKASSQAFGASLESEKEVLAATGAGLERNETGLEAAGRRMGAIRRMSEGKGWWGRMLLYAWIAGLAVVAVLLVFVGPKLRF